MIHPSGLAGCCLHRAPRCRRARHWIVPTAELASGPTVLDTLNWEQSSTRGGQTFPGTAPDSISRQGNGYLRRVSPRLDYIVTARATRNYWDLEPWNPGSVRNTSG